MKTDWQREYEEVVTKAAEKANVETLVKWVRLGRIDHAAALLKKELSPDILSRHDGETALTAAILAHQIEMAEFLLCEGANVNQTNKNGESPLMCACSIKNRGLVSKLLNYGAETNYLRQHLYLDISSAMHKAVSCGSIEILTLLLEHGADVNLVKAGRTLLFEAIYADYPEVLKWLIAQGVDINAKAFSRGCTMSALMTAAELEHTLCAHILIDAGADILFKNKKGQTALYFAKQKRLEELEELLLEKGAEPMDDEEIHWGRDYDHYEWDKMLSHVMSPWINRVLTGRGHHRWYAEEELKRRDELASEEKIKREKEAILYSDISYLRKEIECKHMSLEEALEDGKTPLLYAVSIQNREVIRLLLALGAKPMPALKEAIELKDKHILKLLLDAVLTDTALELGMIPHGLGFAEWDNMWAGHVFFLYQQWDIEERGKNESQNEQMRDIFYIKLKIGMSSEEEINITHFAELLRKQLEPFGCQVLLKDEGSDWASSLNSIDCFEICFFWGPSKLSPVFCFDMYSWKHDVSAQAVAEKMMEWDKSYGIKFEEADHYGAKLKFTKVPEDKESFYKEVFAICPELKENEALEDIQKDFEDKRVLFLKWF